MDPQQDSSEPKKFIRTLAGDIQTVKENGVPDLAPFVHETPPPSPTPVPPPAQPAQPIAPKPTPSKAQTAPVSIPATEKKSISDAGYDIKLDVTAPKKYIRTFAGDMKTVQEKGVPDLAPFVHTAPPEPAHKPEASASPLPPPSPAPICVLSANPASFAFGGGFTTLTWKTSEAGSAALDQGVGTVSPVDSGSLSVFVPATKIFTLTVSGPGGRATCLASVNVAAAPPPPPPPPPKPELPPQEELGPVPLKTYAGDFSDRVEATHASTATILAAEQDTASQTPPPAQQSSRSNLLYIIGGAVLLIAGSTGAYIGYSRYVTALAPVILAPTASTPIFVDDREEISGTSDMLLQAIVQSATRILAPHTVRLLHTPLSTTTDQSIFAQLNVSAPSSIVRNIHAKGSMAGVVHTGEEQSPFFILSVASYGTTLAGMLSWETSMLRSLEMLFPPHVAPIPEPIATSTATTTKESAAGTNTATTTVVIISPITTFTDGFRDEIVANHDVRIYRDAAGRSILLYGYWSQTTLVIARSPEAFAEILERLATSRVP